MQSDEWSKEHLLPHYETLDPNKVKSVHHTNGEHCGINIVGVPLSRDNLYIQRFLRNFISQLRVDVNKTLHIPNSQIKYTLLRYCIVSRITYLMRTLPYHYFEQSFFDDYNSILKDILADIAMVRACDIDDTSMNIAKLHISDGGLSLLNVEDKAIPAFVSSYTAALPDLKEAFPEVAKIIEDKIQMSASDFQQYYSEPDIPET